jgi:hypothetical protein
MSANELPGPGDFARIVEGCECGAMAECIGEVSLVTAVTDPDWTCDCPVCHRTFVGRVVDSPQWRPHECYPQAWMRKVPPDRQLVEEIEREAIPA